MLNIYAKMIDAAPEDLEAFIEIKKGSLRAQVNLLLENRWYIPNAFHLRIFVNEFLYRLRNLCVADSENIFSPPMVFSTEYALLMSFTDLEEMFRQEYEYWVIRKKITVFLIKTEEFIKIKILNDYAKAPNSCLRGNLKALLNLISEDFKTASRVSISESPFMSEDNVVVVFKLK